MRFYFDAKVTQQDLEETTLQISNEEKQNTITQVKQFVAADINQVANQVDANFIIDDTLTPSEQEQQKQSKLYATQLATKLVNQEITNAIFEIRDVVKQYFEASGDNSLNQEVEDLF